MPHHSVAESAYRLQISEQRVRALLQAGRLQGHKVGRTWIVDGDLDPARRRLRGRPLRASNAWALLALLADESADWVDPTTLSRLRKRIRSPHDLAGALHDSQPRSQIFRWRVLPNDVGTLLREYRLVPSGLSAGHAQLDVVSAGHPLDVYVDEKQLLAIERRFRPDRAPAQPNVILRVPSHPWILGRFNQAPLSVVAADLLDDEDPRVANAAARVLESPAP